MVKFICDKCCEEVAKLNRVVESTDVIDGLGVKILEFPAAVHELCDGCNEKLERLNLSVSDFMKLSKEELDFLDYTFKVGDEVITSTGEKGIITDICTCERCKERGFYEPIVETKVGNGAIYITDNDKRTNFCSFYKIGNRVFGNLDEDAVLNSIERNQEQICELDKEMGELRKQYHIVRYYKNKLNGGDDT